MRDSKDWWMSIICSEAIEETILSERRLSREEGLWLWQHGDLLELAQLAGRVRHRLNPEPVVTFVVDSNPNYTNVCITDCVFCAFYRKPGSADGYTLTIEQVMEKVQRAVDQGATTVLLQGGHNPSIPLDYYLSLVRETRRRFPQVTPHFFTAFVPWTFKPGNTPLQQHIRRHAGATQYLRMIALSRLYLDNVPHIQASWFSEGKKTGQIALHFGADDFGGTLFEENVHAATTFINKTTVDEVVTLIQESGFTPAQRTTRYEILRTFEPATAGETI